MPENNQIMSVAGQLVGMPTAGPESFSQQQLDYLKRAIGVDETVLWSGLAAASDFPLSLSESLSNFEKVEFTWIPRYQGDYGSPTVCDTQGTDGYGGTLRYTLAAPYWNANTNWFGWWFLNTTDNQTKLTSIKNAYGNPQTTTALADGLNCRMVKIIGINRIQSA